MRNELRAGWAFLQRLGVAATGAIAGFWLAAAPAFAQQQQEGGPKLQESKAAVEWAIAAAFVVGCLVVAFKNSKRSHVQ